MLKGSLKLIKDAKERGNKAVVGISQEKEKEENEEEEEGVNEETPATEDVAMDLNQQKSEEDKSLQKKLDWTITNFASEEVGKKSFVQKEAHSFIQPCVAWFFRGSWLSNSRDKYCRAQQGSLIW